MKSFKEYLQEEQPGGERPPVDSTERHRRNSRGGKLRGILSNRIVKVGTGDQRKEVRVDVILPPEIDPEK